MKDYVEHLRAKPESVRRTIAFVAAAAIAAVVATGWMIALVSSGTLAIAPVSSSEEAASAFSETQQRFDELAGAASAFYTNQEAAGVTVVEDEAPVPAEPAPQEAKVLHF
ncbi:MAG: hypothetical protein KBD05_03790 [Candidatus Pacebacteria bacterium]|nr:hypothetical protein [Candidatus Paceibacterota bacterium]